MSDSEYSEVKDSSKILDSHHSQRKRSHNSHRGFVVSTGVLALLLWGASLLVLGIARLRSVTLQIKELELIKSSSNSNVLLRDFKDEFIPASNVIGFNETRNSTFSPNFRFIQWISEPDSLIDDKGTFVTSDEDVYKIKSIQDSNYEKTLFNGSHIYQDGYNFSIDSFVASPNLKHALIQTNSSQNWRHSTFGLYWTLDVDTQEITQLNEGLISIAKWAPTSDHIAFVLANNIFIYELSSGKTSQSTFDGSAEIFNGKPDWVYEEEVLEDDTALWWSPNGEYVAFLRSNDSLVPEFPIPYFVQDDGEDIYPELRKLKYPKPGFANPEVSLGIIDVSTKNTKLVDYTYDIFTEIVWVGNDQLLVKATNRESDFLKVILVDAQDLSYEIVRDEVTDSWFEITHDTFFVPKSNETGLEEDGYLDTISFNGFNHLAYFTPPSNSTPKILTSGDWEVVSAPSAFDYEKNLVYYISTQDSSIERHLYSVDLLSGETKKLTHGEGWYSASFSSGARFLSLSYKGPEIPYQQLIDLHTNEVEILEDNKQLSDLLSEYDLSTNNYGEVNIGTAKVNYVERLPPHFNSSAQYPVLFFVYGGPNSQLVTKSFGFSFPDVVASQLNAIVVTVDGRGTGFKGRKFRSLVRDNLGNYEVIDQIAAAKHWATKPYVDESNIAIFGWSYGGYMTLKTLEHDAGDTFKYGMSVAPVTDWRLYDSIYTERYMHTPQNNENGYIDSSVHNVTQIGKATRFLLCHGSGDDNVHFQNSLKFLDKLNLEGVENYDVHVFPDSDHAIRYHNANVIIYDKLLLWLKKAFRGDYINFN